ncbi:GNAT family N-acetyltransferase [Flavobacteriaceae bacterium]|nr:GNAT family N-acetyltransferase [Flavobacteriaceae bacterium]
MVVSENYKFIEIDKQSVLFLDFLENELKANTDFTYFLKRSPSALDNHLITILLIINSEVIGYGHIDKEELNWLGIFISQKHRGKALGSVLLNELLIRSKEINLEIISLSVYKTNKGAYNLYSKKGFKVFKENNMSFFMQKYI